MYYHYTTLETFFRILDGVCHVNGEKCIELRATRIDKLNDPTEMVLNKKQYVELLKAYESTNNVCNNRFFSNDVSLMDICKYDNMCKSEKYGHPPYVSCLSKNGDFMPMWSMYGDTQRGVCLCFDEDLEEPVKRVNTDIILFGRVAYGKYTKSRSVNNALDLYYRYSDGSIEDFVCESFMGVSPFVKNKHYKYENEFRLCLYKFVKSDNGTFYGRDKEYVLIKVPIRLLKSVMLGCKLPQEITESLLKAYFEKEDLNIKIERSKIPFR